MLRFDNSHQSVWSTVTESKKSATRPDQALIAARLPLEEARRAHDMMGDGGVLGKIVLLPNG